MSKFAIIDVETTGGSARFERVTEIAIVLHDGEKVLDSYSTLINPERSIPWNITQLTGISDDMVSTAPKFFEVARKIVEMTENAIFVAHNVTFDFNFIREEFARLGYNYTRQQLCTVRLARKVFPGLPSYSLSNLKNHFGIAAERSHRALDDTLATVRLFEYILAEQEVAGGSFKGLMRAGLKESKLPPGITIDKLDALPEDCGVYYLHDAAGDVIYVGKSLNIRKRLYEHFADTTPKGEKMRAGAADISCEVTGSELVALLLESAEIKRIQPRINRALRMRQYNAGIYTYTDQLGYQCLVAAKPGKKASPGLNTLIELPKLESAKAYLASIVRQYELCHRLCHLDFHERACFHYSIKQCRGACVGEESPEEYNARVEEAMKVVSRALQGNFVYHENGRNPVEKAVVLVEDGRFLGFGFVETEEDGIRVDDLRERVSTPYKDPDAGRIIRSYLEGKMKGKVLRF
ncbi:MAG: GIY-YIG nuclease family protein [Saprospiraceae bacterium]|nr:GIY-YIG nuclease family protein [Saprospiraceae bacterium]